MEITLDGLRTIVHVNGVLVTITMGLAGAGEKEILEPNAVASRDGVHRASESRSNRSRVLQEISVEPLKAKKPKK